MTSPGSTPTRIRRRWSAAAVVVAALGLSSCAVGVRAQLAPEATGSADADRFLALLATGDTAVYTAEYRVDVPMLATTTEAAVSQAAPDERGVTIGDVRYLYEPDGDKQTCVLSTGECSDTLDAARTSDTTLGYDFFSVGLRARLRRDVEVSAVAPSTSSATIAGEQATCLDLAVVDPADSTATVPIQYCVLDDGVLARIARSDVTVELTAWSTTADAELLEA